MAFFAPLLGNQPHTLLLGSMPSQISLRSRRYYANPQNAFWWIVSQIYGFSESLNYSSRTVALTNAGVAVWDVLGAAKRPGSLDRNIDRASEKANDFAQLLERIPSLRLIGFNGAAARQIFMRHCSDVLQGNRQLKWVQLPSTSPAHAALSKPDKLDIWRSALMSVTQQQHYA
ncbi:MAG: DNA-deoxyinosine glycosylase [Gammaproteobacteria bacterium]|nr:DNA-deoxyinosine glycosylase [Gammaproteobacteria bacterium]